MKAYTRDVQKQVNSLVDSSGRCRFGTYKTPIPHLNLLQAKRPLGIPMGARLKNLHLKEWEAYQAGNNRIFMLGAIYNTKVTGLNQLSIYDRSKKQLYNYRRYCLPWKQVLSSSMYNSEASYNGSGFSMTIQNDLNHHRIVVQACISGYEGLPDITLDMEANHITEPIVICQPFSTNRGLYSHKALMTMEGALSIGSDKIYFSPDTAFMIIDDHKGYYPKTVKYDWVTGYNHSNHSLIGFNLTHNQIINPEKYNENCLWLDGKMQVLPPVKFEHTRHENRSVWKIRDDYDRVHVNFYPEEQLELKFNYGIVYSDYEGPIGSYSGYIRQESGHPISVDGFYGMGEKKRYRL